MRKIDEWDLIKREYHENKVCFDVIEEFVEGLIDDINSKNSATAKTNKDLTATAEKPSSKSILTIIDEVYEHSTKSDDVGCFTIALKEMLK